MNAYMYAFCAKETQIVHVLLQIMAPYMTPILLQFIGTTSARCEAETRWLTLFESCTYSDSYCPCWRMSILALQDPCLDIIPIVPSDITPLSVQWHRPGRAAGHQLVRLLPRGGHRGDDKLASALGRAAQGQIHHNAYMHSGCCSSFVCLALVAPA